MVNNKKIEKNIENDFEQKIETKMPLIGDKFPDLTVHTTHGVFKIPDKFKGKWFILFSHPADFTPVCTTEFIEFQKLYPEFKRLNTELIGLSIDQVFSHMKWVEWIKEKMNVEITFPIIADHGELAKRLGMVHPGKSTNTVRSVFIVDDRGYVRIILYYPQEIGRNMDEILRALKAMQISDENGVAMPANWPYNELLKDSVIIPPATDMKKRKEVLISKKYTCFDWWFCYKRL